MPFLTRRAQQNYKLPNSNLEIEKGIQVMVPVDAIHHDPEIFPDPSLFDPERFSPEEVKKRHPMAWLPFGDGPRNCLGLRFGKMQTRVGLVSLLRDFRFSVCEKTEIPIEYTKTNFLLTPGHGIHLKVVSY